MRGGTGREPARSVLDRGPGAQRLDVAAIGCAIVQVEYYLYRIHEDYLIHNELERRDSLITPHPKSLSKLWRGTCSRAFLPSPHGGEGMGVR